MNPQFVFSRSQTRSAAEKPSAGGGESMDSESLHRDMIETTREVEKRVGSAEIVIVDLVYWERNDEIVYSTEQSAALLQLVKSRQPDRTWYGSHTHLGRWLYEVFFGPGDSIIAVRSWIPEPPYSWREQQIFVLKFLS